MGYYERLTCSDPWTLTPIFIDLRNIRAYVSVCGCELVSGAAALKGPMTYANYIRASRLEFEPGGWDLRLEAGIRASRLGFEL